MNERYFAVPLTCAAVDEQEEEKRWEKEASRLRGVLNQRFKARELHETQAQSEKQKVEK